MTSNQFNRGSDFPGRPRRHQVSFDDDSQEDQPSLRTLGFGDRSGAVRVWIDEDNVLNKVRISPRWDEIVDSAAKLAVAFKECFVQINNLPLVEGRREQARLQIAVVPAREPLSAMRLAELSEKADQIQTKINKLDPTTSGKWVGEGAVGEAARGMVKLYLDVHGLLSRIEFNEEWLEAETRVRVVDDAVVAAHRNAVAKFSPPSYEKSERENLNDQLSGVRNEILAMLRRGFG